ncbi:hypothetical protein B0O80DRAFT_60786 [Mortierella sp. GBAus27b]|nr:hypothetical protein B0O80DRAFT_60786 [Mortierella sp. GBAus27b]
MRTAMMRSSSFHRVHESWLSKYIAWVIGGHVNRLNIFNRSSLDIRTALEMIYRRREDHSHVERRQRDTFNSTIMRIAEIPFNCSSTAKLNKGTILRLALEHLRALYAENHSLRSENAALQIFYQARSTPPTSLGAQWTKAHDYRNRGLHPSIPLTLTKMANLPYPCHPTS